MKNYNNLLLTLLTLSAGSSVLNAGYIGASVGYMIDSDEPIYAVQSGTTVSSTGAFIHNVELELAYTESSERFSETVEGETLNIRASAEVLPLMLNYIIKTKPEKNLSFYGGAGAGYSFYDISATTSLLGQTLSISDSGGVFTWQLLAGIQYAFSPDTTLKIGYRYVRLDDLTFNVDGFSYGGTSYDSELISYSDSLDDSVLEAGLIFRF